MHGRTCAQYRNGRTRQWTPSLAGHQWCAKARGTSLVSEVPGTTASRGIVQDTLNASMAGAPLHRSPKPCHRCGRHTVSLPMLHSSVRRETQKRGRMCSCPHVYLLHDGAPAARRLTLCLLAYTVHRTVCVWCSAVPLCTARGTRQPSATQSAKHATPGDTDTPAPCLCTTYGPVACI